MDSDADTVPDCNDRCAGADDREDSDADSVPDGCDLCPGFDDRLDCNQNATPDSCDIAGGASQDADLNGIPDECDEAPQADPNGTNKNRSLSITIPPPVAAGPASLTALRVTLTDLQNPVPPNLTQYPPPDFSEFEAGITCTDPSGCVRWVGKVGTFLESQDIPGRGNYYAARLQCTPHYDDWSFEDVIHVTGAEIVPSSIYHVQRVSAVCMGNEDTCTAVSATTQFTTNRFGDVEAPFQAPPPATISQPDVIDVSQVVAAVKHQLSLPAHPRAQLQPNLPELNTDVNVLDIVQVVDAVKRFPYSFSGPCPCPSEVTCGGSCTGCTGLCLKTCVGGDNDGETCVNNTHCPGVCVGGPTPGAICPSGVPGGINCGIGGVCNGVCSSVGTCYDKCGRCTP